ncbi:MAG: FtsX-like permease family protein [Chitinophagaceae bacterium]
MNIFGLAIGISCAALIFLWVEDEVTFNHNFQRRDYLYRIMANRVDGGKFTTIASTPGPMASALKTEVPGIKNAGRLSWVMNQLFRLDDKRINEAGIYADPIILSMLDLPFIYGDTAGALQRPESVVISESMSTRFFGEENPIGKTLNADSKQPNSVDGVFLITGVFKDLPKNCSYEFQWISPYEIHENKIPSFKLWTPNISETLVELGPSVNPVSVNERLKDYLGTKVKGSTIKCFLFPMNKWHLFNQFTDGKQDGGNIKYVKLFSLLAVMILLIACINFMNLATARSEQRAKEVGVRKVLGAGKSKLIKQFIGESMLMSFLSVFMAIGLLYLILPSYNLLIQKELSPYIFRPLYLGGLMGIGFMCGLIAGSYPAFYLSAFNPVMVLKGLKIRTDSAPILMRKGLVIAQFTVSIILIICTAVIYQQVRYIKHRDLGFKKDNMIYMPLQGNLKDHFPVMRDELIKSGVIENAALTQSEPLHIYRANDNYDWQGKAPGNKVLIRSNSVSPEYISTMKMKLISGRDFYSTAEIDTNNLIINESMAKLMGKTGKPGSVLIRDSAKWTIVGIIQDFVFNDMYSSGMPMLLRCNPRLTEVMVITFKSGADLATALKKAENIFKSYNPNVPFEYFFVDEQFNKIFTTETLIEKLAGIFALLAVFISCLGLLALAAYTAERRTKEIGIRKVLGASALEMVGLLSKDFLKLVILSCVIACPIAWWAMSTWLQNYQYRTPIHWWVFGVAAITALLIALITVSYQAIKAALSNPIQSLRTQ